MRVSAKRSFSTSETVKNALRSTMTQQRFSSLGVPEVKARLAKTIDIVEAIDDDFAARKARKITLEFIQPSGMISQCLIKRFNNLTI